ncbi:MAG: alanine racemase [Pseudomonadota bacterium]
MSEHAMPEHSVSKQHESAKIMENHQFRPVWVEVDLGAAQHNLAVVRESCPHARVMAVVKANGYGHGMLEMAKALQDADEFGVNSIDDVLALRQAGIEKPCTLFAPLLDVRTLDACAEFNARPTIFDREHLELLAQWKTESELDVWLKIDTGMGRLGFTSDDVATLVDTLKSLPCIKEVSLMSHLANADDLHNSDNQTQFGDVAHLNSHHSFAETSVLNSAGVVNFPDHAYQIVRPGMMLYGMTPCLVKSADELGLKRVMGFYSRLISVKPVIAGQKIGYGGDYVVTEDTVMGIAAVGYGDGYPRHAPTGTPVWINGSAAPIMGRVSMDMIAIDLGKVEAKVGDKVELWGSHIAIESLAKACGTIAYELVCGILPRVERHYS